MFWVMNISYSCDGTKRLSVYRPSLEHSCSSKYSTTLPFMVVLASMLTFAISVPENMYMIITFYSFGLIQIRLNFCVFLAMRHFWYYIYIWDSKQCYVKCLSETSLIVHRIVHLLDEPGYVIQFVGNLTKEKFPCTHVWISHRHMITENMLKI
jgi:hypothetical protein